MLSGRLDLVENISLLVAAMRIHTELSKEDHTAINRLRDPLINIFPIRTDKPSAELRSGAAISLWFAADDPILQRVFTGVIPLLDYSILYKEDVWPLLEAMGQFKFRRLSDRVTEKTVHIGETVQDITLTNALRSKAGYFSL